MIDIYSYIASNPFLMKRESFRLREFLIEINQSISSDNIAMSASSMAKITNTSERTARRYVRIMRSKDCWPYLYKEESPKSKLAHIVRKSKESSPARKRKKDEYCGYMDDRIIAARKAKAKKCGMRVENDDIERELTKVAGSSYADGVL